MAQQADATSFGIESDWEGCFVDGEWRSGSGEPLQVETPATREVLTTVTAGTLEDVEDAYDAATRAQPEWAATPPLECASVVQAAMGVMKAHVELDMLAPGMVAEAASFPTRAQGPFANSTIPGRDNEVHREPVGLVGVITPWNVPFHLSMRAVTPAIALGNAVVLKPAPETPIGGGLALAKVFEEAGLPPGVLNVVTGGTDPDDAVASHPDNAVVSFTGSSKVGKLVAQNAGRNLAMPALELGGNNPQVVLEDADLDLAVDAAVFGSFFHQARSVSPSTATSSTSRSRVTPIRGRTSNSPTTPSTD